MFKLAFYTRVTILSFTKLAMLSKEMNIFVVVFFLFSLTSLSRLFHSYRDEPIGRWGETGVHVPRENHLTLPQAELGLSHGDECKLIFHDKLLSGKLVLVHVYSVYVYLRIMRGVHV